MSVDYRERRLRFWCQKVLPLVYDESLSYYELLCKIMKHLSEAETDVSALEDWLAELDATAVKKIYSEFPLQASKDGNVVMLSNTRARDLVTDVAPAIGSPMTVTETTNGTNGHLDPDDEESPVGLINFEKTMLLDINEATTDAKGAMSAADKTKLDALHEVTVVAGSSGNIQVGSATTGYNRRYTVELNPNFEPSIKEWSLTGDEWLWNACLNGGIADVYYSSAQYPNPAVWYATMGTANMSPTENLKARIVREGVYNDVTMSESPAKLGCVFGSESTMPFTRLQDAGSIVDGGLYYTTLDAIRLKCQVYGAGVANKTFKIYLGTNALSGQNSPANTYKVEGNYYFPNANTKFTPAEYTATTDANGYFDVTIPAGLTATAYNTTSLPGASGGLCRQMAIVADGDPDAMYGNVRVDSMKIAVIGKLNA